MAYNFKFFPTQFAKSNAHMLLLHNAVVQWSCSETMIQFDEDAPTFSIINLVLVHSIDMFK